MNSITMTIHSTCGPYKADGTAWHFSANVEGGIFFTATTHRQVCECANETPIIYMMNAYVANDDCICETARFAIGIKLERKKKSATIHST